MPCMSECQRRASTLPVYLSSPLLTAVLCPLLVCPCCPPLPPAAESAADAALFSSATEELFSGMQVPAPTPPLPPPPSLLPLPPDCAAPILLALFSHPSRCVPALTGSLMLFVLCAGGFLWDRGVGVQGGSPAVHSDGGHHGGVAAAAAEGDPGYTGEGIIRKLLLELQTRIRQLFFKVRGTGEPDMSESGPLNSCLMCPLVAHLFFRVGGTKRTSTCCA